MFIFKDKKTNITLDTYHRTFYFTFIPPPHFRGKIIYFLPKFSKTKCIKSFKIKFFNFLSQEIIDYLLWKLTPVHFNLSYFWGPFSGGCSRKNILFLLLERHFNVENFTQKFGEKFIFFFLVKKNKNRWTRFLETPKPVLALEFLWSSGRFLGFRNLKLLKSIANLTFLVVKQWSNTCFYTWLLIQF